MGYHRAIAVNPPMRAMAVMMMVLVPLLSHKISAQDCQADRDTVKGLAPCAPVALNAKLSRADQEASPSDSCCDALRARGLDCLCSIYEHLRSQASTYLNLSAVRNLPKQCGITVPTGYICDGEVIPY